MSKFKKTLEEKATEITAYPAKAQWENSVPGMIRREIALTVDQIKCLQQQHEERLHGLLKLECYVGTDLRQMEARQPRYTPYHFPEKEKLKQRLFEIEKERRNLSLRLEEKTQSLEDKLLSLINKHQQLDN